MLRHAVQTFILLSAVTATAANAAPVRFDTGTGANGSYYEIGLQATNWANASAIAGSLSHAGLSGHLATITSAEEEAFIANLLLAASGTISGQSNQSIAWIGLTDQAVEGDFRWAGGPEAGSAPGYTNWLPNEPNNLSGVEDHVHMTVNYAYGWNDLSGNAALAYVIEYSDPNWQGSTVAEPANLALFGLGLAGLGIAVRRRKAH